MLTKGVKVFFLKHDEIKTGEIQAVITETIDDGAPTKSFKIVTECLIYTVQERLVSASIEGLFRFLFEDYQAKGKTIKGRTGKVQKELDWERIFPNPKDQTNYVAIYKDQA